jgi:hypothetical protein
LGTQPLSLKTSGATVTDWLPPASASWVVHVPSQGFGASNAVAAPMAEQVPLFAVSAVGNAQEPVGGWHVHWPHVGVVGGPTP